MNNNENKYYTASGTLGDPAFDNFSPSGFHLDCDFEHNYYWVPNTDLAKPDIIQHSVKLRDLLKRAAIERKAVLEYLKDK